MIVARINALTSIKIGMWFIGGQEESLSWSQTNKVEEEHTETADIPWKLIV